MKDDVPHTDARTDARSPLERSSEHRVVAGVCGGLGRYLDIDPVVFRVVIAVLSLWGGVGLFIYGMAWLIVPLEGTGHSELRRLLSGRVDGQSLGAVLVTVLGSGIFFTYMGSSDHVFPLLLIGLLAFAALRYDPDKFQSRRRQAPPAAPRKPADTATEPTPPPAPAWWQRPDPMRKPTAPAAEAEAPTDAVPGPAEPPVPPTPPVPPVPPIPLPAPYPRRTRSVVTSLFFSLAVITSGAVWSVGERAHHGVNLLAVLASALLVLGLGLMVAARWGRGRGLVLWAVLLTLAVAAVGASPVELNTRYEHVTWTPASAGALQSSYRLGSGQAMLNLSGVAPAAGQSVETTVSLGAGKLTVVLPSGPDSPQVRITAHASVGDIRLPDGSGEGGVSPARTVDLNPAGAAAHGTIDLDVSVGAGQVEVTQ